MRLKPTKRLTRIQFEKMFPQAETSPGPSWEVPEQPAKIAIIGEKSYCARTWAELEKKVRA